MSKFFRWNMLVTSFIPLWISIIFVLLWDINSRCYSNICSLLKGNSVQIGFLIFIVIILVISTVAVIRFLSHKRKQNEVSGYGKIISAQKSATLVTDFLLTYIMPLIAFDFTDLRDIILFLLYFLLIVFLNIRNGNVYTNILFEFMGYRVYICNIERNITGKTYLFSDCSIISKENLTGKIGQDFPHFDFDNSTYLNLNPPKGN